MARKAAVELHQKLRKAGRREIAKKHPVVWKSGSIFQFKGML